MEIELVTTADLTSDQILQFESCMRPDIKLQSQIAQRTVTLAITLLTR